MKAAIIFALRRNMVETTGLLQLEMRYAENKEAGQSVSVLQRDHPQVLRK